MPSAPSAVTLFVAATGLTAVALVSGGVAWVASWGGDDDTVTTAAPPASTPAPTATPTTTPTPDGLLTLPPTRTLPPTQTLPSALAPTATDSPAADLPSTDSATIDPTATEDSTKPTATPGPDAYAKLPAEPWEDPELEFGYLTRARSRNGVVTITLNPARFLGGEAAVRANGGVRPQDDYLVVDDSRRTSSYPLDPDAVLRGTDALGSDEDPATLQKITTTQLRTRLATALETGRQPMVWLRHGDGPGSPVTYLQEQYVP